MRVPFAGAEHGREARRRGPPSLEEGAGVRRDVGDVGQGDDGGQA
ncbi:hypothetical protein [Janibacter melonis]|nr:hypothetical protein [Janibacter melonis]